jgi:hypothetical protein
VGAYNLGVGRNGVGTVLDAHLTPFATLFFLRIPKLLCIASHRIASHRIVSVLHPIGTNLVGWAGAHEFLLFALLFILFKTKGPWLGGFHETRL